MRIVLSVEVHAYVALLVRTGPEEVLGEELRVHDGRREFALEQLAALGAAHSLAGDGAGVLVHRLI